MLKKLLLVTLVVVFAFNVSNAQDNSFNLISKIQYKVKMIGDALVGVRADGKSNNYGLPNISSLIKRYSQTNTTQDWIGTVTFVSTGSTSIYDLCSNGVPQAIWQDPTTPDNIHVTVMTAPWDDGTSFPTRRSKYYYSSDRGVTWTYIGDVPIERSGFTAISGFSDGSALIANHSASGGGDTRAQAFKDAAPGLGSFTRLDAPGNTGPYIWPRIAATSSLSITNKLLMIASINGQDTTRYNIATDVNATPGTWLGWNTIPSDQAETYWVAIGTDNRVGIAFKNNDGMQPSDYGDVWFIESTNNGSNFSAPLKIYDANFSGDSLGCIRGLSMVYQGNVPKVVFETVKQTQEGTFFPGAPAAIRFWSTNLPGSDPNRSIVIGDTNLVGYHPYIGVNDVLSSLGRPTIGRSADGNVLFAAYMVPSDEVGGISDTTTFGDIWFTASGNNGLSWKPPVKINPTSPRMDWRYCSLSPVSDNSGNNYYANMLVLKDTIPGSYVNGAGNGQSLAEFMFVRIAVPGPVFVNKISNEVPSNYTLSQNYPNPFNPVTKINFSVPKSNLVSLKVFDITGKEVASLVNEVLSAGTYNYSFNAANLPSGIYFYTLASGDFKETKKMMLIK